MMDLVMKWKGLASHSLLLLSFILSTLSIPATCNATRVVHQLDQQQMFENYDQEVCPPWFYFNTVTSTCKCLAFYAASCFDNKAYLSAGFCATFDTDSDILSLGECPSYHGFTFSKHGNGDHWYIQLPHNVSELNDYMCGTLNRKGRLCSECKDGYGLATTSLGFQYFECSKCAGAWYGVPLFLFLEMFPLTVLYLVILLFQVNITSGSITCFILYSQLVVIAFDRVFGSGDYPQVSDIIYVSSDHAISKWFYNIIMTFYDVWNLRFFRNVLPSFCIISGLKPIHISFLDYLSVFYPVCLIFLTWVCVELYDRKFRLLVWLWKPFQRCLNGKVYRVDFINAFASFFLLSFTKTMYQVLLLLILRKIEGRRDYHQFLGYTYVVGVDQTVLYGSTEHLLFVIPAVTLFFILGILPTLFLILYPIRPFRVLFSKCRLDGIVINTFVEKFYSCYRTGLDGGRDMRSFAGLYFVTRVLLFLCNVLAGGLQISENDPYFMRNIILAITVLLIVVCRPYKETYMNKVDTILLIHLGLLCHLVSAEHGFRYERSLAITFEVMIMFPLLCFILFLIVKSSRLQKTFKIFYQNSKSCIQGRRNEEQEELSSPVNSPSVLPVLIEPITLGDSNYYGAV
jgi:hypothetical protein